MVRWARGLLSPSLYSIVYTISMVNYLVSGFLIFLVSVYNRGMEDKQDKLVIELPGADVFPVVRDTVRIVADSWGDWERIKGRPFRRAVLDDGRRVLVYDNGAVKGADNGGSWIVASPEHGITGDNARDHHKLRREKAERAFLAGIADGQGLPASLDAAFSGWQRIAAAQYKLAVDHSRGRTSTEAAKFIGRTAGFIEDRSGRGGGDSGMTLHLGNDVAQRLADILASKVLSSGDDG